MHFGTVSSYRVEWSHWRKSALHSGAYDLTLEFEKNAQWVKLICSETDLRVVDVGAY